ncbi:MAG: WYL domain-containing protein [Hymenobacter sp.]|nr:MAG: WYL domain-containing protein [Hymenobacter sp.]
MTYQSSSINLHYATNPILAPPPPPALPRAPALGGARAGLAVRRNPALPLARNPIGDFEGGYTLRTFQRDKQEIIDLFGITIRARKGQGYYLAETEPLPAEHARLLETVELQAFLQLPQALRPHVQPEARRPLGLEHLRPLLRAAQARQVVEFQYQKYWEDTAETRTVGPLLLKEFRGRWYVLAVMAWSGRLACFGLDRTRELRSTDQKFTPPPASTRPPTTRTPSASRAPMRGRGRRKLCCASRPRRDATP